VRGGRNNPVYSVKDRDVQCGNRSDEFIDEEGDAFEALAGGTHPRAQCARMRSGLVMSMVAGVPHGLWEHQPAEAQQAQSQSKGQKPNACWCHAAPRHRRPILVITRTQSYQNIRALTIPRWR
jgi:hypothetical protein